MKKAFRFCLTFVFCAVMFFSFSLFASAAYEPDGSTSVEYAVDSVECNRTLVVNCVDESGVLLKSVQFQTKKGEELLALVNLNGYELIGFNSDQGLWETCKVSWSSVNYVDYSSIFIWYHFRSEFSMKVMTATVTLRKSEAITVKTCHNLRSDAGIDYNSNWYSLKHTDMCEVSYKEPFTSAARAFEGHYLMSGYSFQANFKEYPYGSPSLISGDFYYTMIEDAYGISDITDWMTWKVVDSTLKEEYKEYTVYSEEKDGSMGYCTDRVLQLDLYYQRCQYDIMFSANGGNDAPETIAQYYGYNIVIPKQQPTRTGYFFLGWSTDINATSVEYVSGQSYPVTEVVTFYAVWEKDDYEFSISELKISENEIFQNSIITVQVRTDSWDQNDSYTDIPIKVYFKGNLLATQLVDFEIYGVAYVTFEIDVGTVPGVYELEIDINRIGIGRETNQTNNRVSTVIEVKKEDYAFSVMALNGNAPYTEGVTVITAYLISNDSERSVRPEAETPVLFSSYFYEGGERILISLQTWDGLAIPFGEQNLVYFKWRVPEDLVGRQIFCECSVNADGTLKENNRQNNTAILVATVATRESSQTANPSFTTNAPSDYVPKVVPQSRAGSASWTVWEYENGEFVLKTYAIKLAEENPEIVPDANCPSAHYNGDKWTMRSGYGITLSYSSNLVALDGAELPPIGAYTAGQTARASFLEYGYSEDIGKYRELVWYNGAWCFAENAGAENSGRVHYIPLWLTDGEYVVSVTLTDIWTPVGQITAVRSSNGILIDGSLYDDWYN